MRAEVPRAEINISHIPAESNVGGLLFALGTMAIFLIGIPAIWPMFVVAAIAGGAVGLVLRFVRR